MRIAECGLRIGWIRGAAIEIGVLTALMLSSFIAADEPPPFKLQTLRGRIVFLNEALEKRYGITTVPEAAERTLAIQTADGTLAPIVEDVRGRAFRTDERLRKPEVEILVRRYDGSPAVQVIRLFELAKDGKYELDYWCDVCAISMVELKPCECCQDETRLRRQKVDH